jgi:hypothetical protein
LLADYLTGLNRRKLKVENAPVNLMSDSAGGVDENSAYTDDEKVYLKKNWRSE